MSTTEQLKQRIMRRIYALYVLRLFTQSVSSRVALMLIALAGIASSVSVPNVLKNMPQVSDLPALSSFYLSAFSETTLAVQLLVFALLVSAMLLSRDLLVRLRRRLTRESLLLPKLSNQRVRS